jgi:signal peptidase I
MSELALALFLAAVGIVGFLIQAVILFLTAKLLRTPLATFWRSLVATFLLGLIPTAILVARYWLYPQPSWYDLILLVGLVVIQPLLILLCYRTSFGRSFLIWLLSSVVNSVPQALLTVILVFVLRFFAMEGFVVPTGAMAETIDGYHKDVTCPACGHPFAVNCSREAEPFNPMEWQPVASCTCPNCRAEIPMLSETREADGRILRIPKYETHSGDRILVSKLTTGDYGGPPKRFDIVVFRYPVAEEKGGPSVMYVKRLIGLPGETVAIREGKIYVLPPDKSPKYDDSKVKPNDLWKPEHLHENDDAALAKFPSAFTILRKSPNLVLAQRQLVYDNDQHPANQKTPRWRGDAWSEDGTTLRHAGEKSDWLRYQHLLRDDKPHLITDFSGYNSGEPGESGERWVGDLMIECEANLEPSAEELTLQLARGPDHFRARFDPKTGRCTLLRLSDDKEEPLATEQTKLRSGTHRIHFANVDARLLVWVDDELPFGDGVTYEPSESLGPWFNDFTPAAVSASGGVGVSKLKLWRDVYYTTNKPGENLSTDDMGALKLHGRLEGPPVRTFYVHPGHYLALGDNSAASADSRYWGLVPERLHIGRVVYRYYPFTRLGPVR